MSTNRMLIRFSNFVLPSSVLSVPIPAPEIGRNDCYSGKSLEDDALKKTGTCHHVSASRMGSSYRFGTRIGNNNYLGRWT